QVRHLFAAGRAPRRPHVEEDGVAAEVGERDGVAVEGAGGVLGRGRADGAARQRRVRAGGEQRPRGAAEGEGADESKSSCGHLSSTIGTATTGGDPSTRVTGPTFAGRT